MILVGLGVIAYTVATRIADRGGQQTAAPAPLPAPAQSPAGVSAQLRPFGDVRVEVPKGTALGPAAFEGDRVIIQLRIPGGGTRLLVVDLATGRKLGTIDLVPSEKE